MSYSLVSCNATLASRWDNLERAGHWDDNRRRASLIEEPFERRSNVPGKEPRKCAHVFLAEVVKADVPALLVARWVRRLVRSARPLTHNGIPG